MGGRTPEVKGAVGRCSSWGSSHWLRSEGDRRRGGPDRLVPRLRSRGLGRHSFIGRLRARGPGGSTKSGENARPGRSPSGSRPAGGSVRNAATAPRDGPGGPGPICGCAVLGGGRWEVRRVLPATSRLEHPPLRPQGRTAWPERGAAPAAARAMGPLSLGAPKFIERAEDGPTARGLGPRKHGPQARHARFPVLRAEACEHCRRREGRGPQPGQDGRPGRAPRHRSPGIR